MGGLARGKQLIETGIGIAGQLCSFQLYECSQAGELWRNRK
jgi:hypothetical protein